MLGKSIVSKWCATLDDIFGIVTCVSVHDYGIRYVCIIGLRNFVGIGDWHTILLLLLNSCLALMFVFSLLFVLQAEEGADKEDVSTFIKKIMIIKIIL